MEENSKETKIKDLVSFIHGQTNIAGFKFLEEAKERFPMFKEELIKTQEAIHKIANFDYSILDGFYKTDESPGSIKLAMGEEFSSLMKEVNNCKIKKRLLIPFGKIKKAYVVKDNFNFFVIKYEDKKIKISAVRKCQLIREIQNQILKYIICNKSYIAHYYPRRNSIGLNEFERQILDTIIQLVGEAKEAESLIQRTPWGDRLMAFSPFRGIIIHQKARANYNLKDIEKSILDELLPRVKEDMSFSTAINGTIDIVAKLRKEIDTYTMPHGYIARNPFTGLQAIKTMRVARADCELPKEKVDELIKNFTETNAFFEQVSGQIKIRKSKLDTSESKIVKMIKGDEILALYNISSYYGTNYNSKNATDAPKNGYDAGPLFGSCMRYPKEKEGLSFYSRNDDIVKMLTCTNNNGKTLLARAIVWHDKEEKVDYVDRIFYNSEENLIELIKYINETENTYSISSYNAGKGLRADKQKSNFLIPFDGAKPSKGMPYFDTVSKSMFVKNNKFFIGKPKDYTGYPSNGKIKQDVVYFTNISLQDINKINVEKIEKEKRERCPICGNLIKSEYVKVEDLKICKKHVYLNANGERMIALCSGVVNIDRESSGEVYVKYALGSEENKRLMRLNELKVIDTNFRDSTIKVLRRFNLYTAAYRSIISSEISLSDFVRNETKKSKELYGLSVFVAGTPEKNSVSCAEEKYESSSRLFYNPEEIEELQLEGRTLLIPKAPTEEQKKYIKSQLKLAVLCEGDAYAKKKIEISDIEKFMDFSKAILEQGSQTSITGRPLTEKQIRHYITKKDWYFAKNKIYSPFGTTRSFNWNGEIVEWTKIYCDDEQQLTVPLNLIKLSEEDERKIKNLELILEEKTDAR